VVIEPPAIDPESGSGECPGCQPPAVQDAEGVPGVRRGSSASGRRGGVALRKHELPGAAEGINPPFCRRGVMDIDGMGTALVDQLVDQGFVKSVSTSTD